MSDYDWKMKRMYKISINGDEYKRYHSEWWKDYYKWVPKPKKPRIGEVIRHNGRTIIVKSFSEEKVEIILIGFKSKDVFRLDSTMTLDDFYEIKENEREAFDGWEKYDVEL